MCGAVQKHAKMGVFTVENMKMGGGFAYFSFFRLTYVPYPPLIRKGGTSKMHRTLAGFNFFTNYMYRVQL